MQTELESQLQEKFSATFAPLLGMPPKREIQHAIPLKDESLVVNIRPFKYSYYQKTEMERLVHEMLQNGILRYSNNPFSSHALLVKKKDQSWRFCVDYRSLNQATILDCFSILIVEELFDELYGATIFSKLDLRSGTTK